MASSVFTESPISTNDSALCSQSNIVVLYGKNGINVDKNGLDCLIEERNVSSVSVVRLSSPTPSMKEAENETTGLSSDIQDASDLISSLEFSPKRTEEPAELVGLTVEEFYPAEEAKKLAKEILDYAGVQNPLQIKVDYEFQRFVIQNDHCYTPLTSPSQARPKVIASTSTGVSNIDQNDVPVLRQYSNRTKKPVEFLDAEEKAEKETEEEEDASDYTDSSLSDDTDNDRDSDLDFNVNNRSGRRTRKISNRKTKKVLPKITKKRQLSADTPTAQNKSWDEERKSNLSRANRQSAETRKPLPSPVPSPPVTPKAQPKTYTITKPFNKFNIQNIQKMSDSEKAELQLQSIEKTLKPRIPIIKQQDPMKPQIQQIILLKKDKKPPPGQQQDIIFTDINSILSNNDGGKKIIKLSEAKISSAPIARTPISTPPLPLPTAPECLPASRITTTYTTLPTTTSQISHTIVRPVSVQQQIIAPIKGFMPLVAETAIKNQLPAQISIQTHVNSSDLTAEHDKQLDLIDSIVKDEMEKSNIMVKKTMNEDIPQIVKMLENTEKAVLNKSKDVDITRIVASASSTFTHPVEDIDITNAPLLDSAEDDLTDDLLQHVAELMDQKNLQEVIENQVMNTNVQQTQPPALSLDIPKSNIISKPTLPIEIDNIAQKQTQQKIQQQRVPPQLVQQQIQPQIQKQKPEVQVESQLLYQHQQQQPEQKLIMQQQQQQNNQPPTMNMIKKEPIKIVRGDGRIITLPPIEAPTTRAKRRAAQSQNVPAPSNALPATVKPVPEIKPESPQVVRRESGEQQKTFARKRTSISSQSTPKEEEPVDSTDSESSDSEDDPNRLWCICSQPHNNRFMICCDKCEEWFHGTCVNITKAMGLEMEQNGIEWTCPKCLQSKKPQQRKITELFEKKRIEEPKKPTDLKKIPPNMVIKKIDVRKNLEVQKKITNTAAEATPKKMTNIVKPLATPKNKIEIQSIKIIEAPSLPVKQETVLRTPPSTVVKPSLVSQLSQDVDIEMDRVIFSCIVCKKEVARPNSIYCSDDCIRKHAQNALVSATKAKSVTASVSSPLPEEKKKKAFSSFEEALAKASEPTLQMKNKVERVYVFERKTSRLLTGNNAPTTANLKKWLQENPTFEVVLPGSPQALAIERSKQKSKGNQIEIRDPEVMKKLPETPKTSKVQIITSSQLMLSKPQIGIATQVTSTKAQKVVQYTTIKSSNFYSAERKSPIENKTQIEIKPHLIEAKPQSEQKTPASESRPQSDTKFQNMTKNPTKKTPPMERKSSSPVSNTSTNRDTEPIRLNVKKTLKEQLVSRMNEITGSDVIKLNIDEIEKFANDTEHEMFKLFNRDTGAKYKAKYRSLMFNIKDRKNQTLFQKICEKQIEPKQLVRMSPEELASQELAQWRQNENKHQLEMIKKSELDLLSCAKNYVLKTHKGEEVIESKSTDRVELDITIPVEDVVTVLNNSTVSSTSESGSLLGQSKEYNKSRDIDSSYDFDISLSSTSQVASSKVSTPSSSAGFERKKSKSKEKDRDRHHRSKEKHRSRKRSRTRSRSREHHHKTQNREEKREVEGHREKERDIHRKEKGESKTKPEGKEKSENKEKQEIKEKIVPKLSIKFKDRDNLKSYSRPAIFKDKEISRKTQDYNLIDKILESTKTVEEAANLFVEKEKPTSSKPSVVVKQNENSNSAGVDSDQEPSSTVVIATPPEDKYNKYSSDLASIIWSGSINMIDVATFQIIVQPVSGVYTDLDKELPMELDVVGRISPDTVWDYISKIKKSPNKEIVIIRLIPSCDSENIAYSALYLYLDKRKRLGVVKTTSPSLKDFYILPLGNSKLLPSVLQPHNNTEFFDDENRPDLLMGIIIRIMGKRPAPPVATPHIQSKIRKVMEQSVISNKDENADEESYTPPNSPKKFSSRKGEGKNLITASRLPPKLNEPIDISTISTTPKVPNSQYANDDADEPYSPGGSCSDDDLTSAPALSGSSSKVDPMTDELKRKMDEINRQIEAQKMEIAGMLNMEVKTASGAYSPTHSPKGLAPALASISIPSNLQQILASIKTSDSAMPANIPPPPVIGSLINDDEIINEFTPMSQQSMNSPNNVSLQNQVNVCSSPNQIMPLVDVPLPPIISAAPPVQSTSRLAQLSEAELLSMVPDDIDFDEPKQSGTNNQDVDNKHQFPDHILSPADIPLPAPTKKGRWDKEPPPPGLEDEYA